MYSPGNDIPRVGRVSIDIKGQSYRLRFTYPEGERHEITVARVSPEGWATTHRAALGINRDIDLGEFDDTYARYSPRHAKKLERQRVKITKKDNLKEVWERYKEIKQDTASESSKKTDWVRLEKLLNMVELQLLELNKAEEFVDVLFDRYSQGTLNPRFRLLYAAINLSVKQKKIATNPYMDFHSPYKRGKRKIECFEGDEIQQIIKAFESDEFKPVESNFSHSFYTPLIQFLALTGCRPSEAHALTWDDIKQKGGKTYIRFNKAWVLDILIPHTKTKEVRLFPCNQQLIGVINSLPKIENKHNLIFPSVGLGYINQGNFRKRYWKPVVNGLVKQGKVEKYLKPYCLRHSFITRLVREGVDIATVASVVGNSTEIIMSNYLAAKNDIDLPKL